MGVEARGDGPSLWGSKQTNAKAPWPCGDTGHGELPRHGGEPSEPGSGHTPLLSALSGQRQVHLSARPARAIQ